MTMGYAQGQYEDTPNARARRDEEILVSSASRQRVNITRKNMIASNGKRFDTSGQRDFRRS